MPLAINLPKVIAKALTDFCAKGDTRYAMNGINLEIDNGRVILSASDTHRLVIYSPVTDPDMVGLLSAYEADTRKARKAETEAKIRAEGKAAGFTRAEEFAKLENRIAAALDMIDKGAVAFLLTVPAFKGRQQKIPKSNDVLFSLESFRPDEIIDGQFPRYRDVLPNGATKPGIRMVGEYTGLTLPQNSTFNLSYIADCVPVLSYMNTPEMMQSEPDCPALAESGPRPWNFTVGTVAQAAGTYYLAICLMPIRERS